MHSLNIDTDLNQQMMCICVCQLQTGCYSKDSWLFPVPLLPWCAAVCPTWLMSQPGHTSLSLSSTVFPPTSPTPRGRFLSSKSVETMFVQYLIMFHMLCLKNSIQLVLKYYLIIKKLLYFLFIYNNKLNTSIKRISVSFIIFLTF